MIQVLPSRSARSANLRQNTSCSGTPVAWQTIDLKQRPTFASCSHRSGLRQIRDFSVNAICGHVVISRRLTILRPQLGQSVTSGQHAFGRLEAVLRQGSRSRRLAVEVRSADSGVKQWKRYSRYVKLHQHQLHISGKSLFKWGNLDGTKRHCHVQTRSQFNQTCECVTGTRKN